jgi:hypothetical protein
LVEIASMLAGLGAKVGYVDTHAFLLHAPHSDVDHWQRDIAKLVEKYPAYARYRALARKFLSATKRYRCSSGLVVDALREQRSVAALGEANAITRAELIDQIASEQLNHVGVSNDAVDALRSAGREGETLLIHIDPFSLSSDLWTHISQALDSACSRSLEIAVVVYRYSRTARSPWPPAPTRTTGPVAETRGGPHELAVYASSSISEAVRAICVSLGWR